MKTSKTLLLKACVGGLLLSSAAMAEQCKKQDFNAFLSKYSEDKSMQMKHAKYPIAIERMQGMSMTSKPVKMTGSLSKDIVKGTFYPEKAIRDKEKLKQGKIQSKDNKKMVSLSHDETGSRIDYVFSQETDKCWYLSKIVYSSN